MAPSRRVAHRTSSEILNGFKGDLVSTPLRMLWNLPPHPVSEVFARWVQAYQRTGIEKKERNQNRATNRGKSSSLDRHSCRDSGHCGFADSYLRVQGLREERGHHGLAGSLPQRRAD